MMRMGTLIDLFWDWLRSAPKGGRAVLEQVENTKYTTARQAPPNFLDLERRPSAPQVSSSTNPKTNQ